jgi:hypothetical protein
MPLLPYVNRLEPVDDAAIWRYLDLRKLRDLIASEELYFRRADLFTDKALEQLPHPAPLNLNPGHSWVPDCRRRRIDLRSLVTDVVISPSAEPDAVEEILASTDPTRLS